MATVLKKTEPKGVDNLRKVFKLVENASKDAYVAKTFGEKLMAAYQRQESPKGHTVEQIIDVLNKADPEDGKNLVWIARMYTKFQFKFEDVDKIREELTNFNAFKSTMSNKDLNSFTDLNAFYDAVEAAQGPKGGGSAPVARSVDEKRMYAANNEWIIDTPNFKAFIPRDFEASKMWGSRDEMFGSDTKWCTAMDSESGRANYEHYMKRGDLVIVVAKFSDGKWHKFQFHYSTDSFMDRRDQRASQYDIDELSAITHEDSEDGPHFDFLVKMIEKHE